MRAEQKGSRLATRVRREDGGGERVVFEPLGGVELQDKTSRHASVPILNPEHTTRVADPVPAEGAVLLDESDVEKLVANPLNPYAMKLRNATGRKIDSKVISAATGAALDKDGTSNSLPAAQQIAVDFGGGGDVGLTIEKLIEAREIILNNDFDDDAEMFCAVTQTQMSDLLKQAETQSIDTNIVRALVAGDVTKYAGFNFVRVSNSLLTTSGGDRVCFAWARDSIGLAIGKQPKITIERRADKNAMQVLAEVSCAAVRVEDEGVVQILCDE